MYPATCAACGQASQVPFAPRLDRPVYCSDCFASRQASTATSSGRRNGYEVVADDERPAGLR
jgi:CxxC-x17-CxxC domain-containing protein